MKEYEKIAITVKEKRILEHALGVREKFPKELCRNCFVAIDEEHSDYPELASLEIKGLLKRYVRMESLCFSVTDLGIDLVRSLHNG